MLLKLIILQFSAHLLADYLFQPQRWSDQKSKKATTAHHLFHTAVVFWCSWICSLDFGFWKAALVLAVSHLLIDVLKSSFSNKYRGKPFEKHLFFIDQAFHIFTLIGVCAAYSSVYIIHFEWDIPIRGLAVVAGFILCTKPANILIRNIFLLYNISISPDETIKSEDKSLPNAGKLIGITERFIALALVLSGQYTALGFIITAKSILRFGAAKINEYVLVGTLLSFGIAVLTGILINWIKIIG